MSALQPHLIFLPSFLFVIGTYSYADFSSKCIHQQAQTAAVSPNRLPRGCQRMVAHLEAASLMDMYMQNNGYVFISYDIERWIYIFTIGCRGSDVYWDMYTVHYVEK